MGVLIQAASPPIVDTAFLSVRARVSTPRNHALPPEWGEPWRHRSFDPFAHVCLATKTACVDVHRDFRQGCIQQDRTHADFKQSTLAQEK
ncbi:MAG: hypothetical protein JNK85_04530 [Verrucomicrobiales bacterium]|nr:hypothetical protein [Verrucomicrobiales bacterium]